MGLGHTKFRGKVRLKGKPKEMAKAEIMLLREKDRLADKARRRKLFTLLDGIMALSFILSIYFVFISQYIKAVLFLIIAILPLTYFILRRVLKNKKKKK